MEHGYKTDSVFHECKQSHTTWELHIPQTIKTEDPTFLETLLILYNGRICEVHCVLIHGNDSL